MKNKIIDNRGITLIALIVTIIVLIILAGVTIATLTGDNGLLQKAQKAQSSSEIGEEKEIIALSANQVKADNLGEELIRNKLNDVLNKNSKENNKARITDDDEGIFIITFDSQRTYTLDSNTGKIDILERKKDNAPGNIKIGINGETLAGTENSPYEIWSIEDLVEWSVHYSNYRYSSILLMQDLDFNSNLSYTDGKMLECTSIAELKDKLTNTNGEGFIPIDYFRGVFDGKRNKIDNIYIKRRGGAALLGGNNGEGGATIKNLKISGNITSTGGNAAGISLAGGSIIINCVNNAKITGNQCTGGIIANGIGSKIYNCINNGEIIGEMYYTGGIASGHSNGSVIVYNSCNTGKVSNGGNAGGIVGCYGKVYNSYNLGTINSPQYAGGICGSGYSRATNCYNIGEISGTYVGYIISSSTGSTADKCSYLKIKSNINAVGGISDDTTKVTAVDDISKITAEILNTNIDSIEHEEEWARWIDGPNGYPVFK